MKYIQCPQDILAWWDRLRQWRYRSHQDTCTDQEDRQSTCKEGMTSEYRVRAVVFIEDNITRRTAVDRNIIIFISFIELCVDIRTVIFHRNALSVLTEFLSIWTSRKSWTVQRSIDALSKRTSEQIGGAVVQWLDHRIERKEDTAHSQGVLTHCPFGHKYLFGGQVIYVSEQTEGEGIY